MQPKLFSLIDKAAFDFDLFGDGRKILVGASGGKDSTLLLEYLSNRMKRRGTNFTVKAAYVKTDFAPEFNGELLSLVESWGIKVATIPVDTLARVKEGRKMNCWWCSTQRRKELLDYAIKNGFDTLALGHHLDDILETFLMNMMEKGEISTMTPNFRYEKYPLSIIRPLAYCPVGMISERAEEMGWRRMTCTCTYQDNSGRKDARRRLELLTGGSFDEKMRMMEALRKDGKL